MKNFIVTIKKEAVSEESKFCEYVLEFYGPKGIYKYKKPFEIAEIETALRILMIVAKPEFDTIDRERVRDIIFAIRNHQGEPNV